MVLNFAVVVDCQEDEKVAVKKPRCESQSKASSEIIRLRAADLSTKDALQVPDCLVLG